ncbi:tyrosine-type recombinase/integrase [Planctomicrobium sp. SH668]|uniref:tyrosine-type recombinase/integrase n=1 Tax=Planctomicrobium sp. SH668 TaxID=3448126 RepID=UPI003F5BF857
MPAPKSNRFRFTKRDIEALPLPDLGRAFFYDEATPSLAVCVSSAGSKTFYSYRKIEGRPVRLKLGTFPQVSLEQARNLCVRASGEIANGRNPHRERQSNRRASAAAWSMDELREWYLTTHAEPHKKSAKHDRQRWDRHLKSWKARRLDTIEQGDIRRLHAKLGKESGRTEANRLLVLLRTAFNLAIKSDEVPFKGVNPAVGIKMFAEIDRDRFLSADEMVKFFNAVHSEPHETFRDLLLMAAYTGQRIGNVAAMRWDNLNIAGKEWRLPGKSTKNGSPLTVHLPQPAVELLQTRKAAANCEWVFPASRSDSKYGHIGYPQKAWERLIKNSGLVDVRPHDIRRSVGSWALAGGTPLPVVSAMLGHRDVTTTARVYARFDAGSVKAAIGNTVEAMLNAANKENAGE